MAGGIDECVSQLLAALRDWDFSPAFLPGYPVENGVQVQTGWPWQDITQIEIDTNGTSLIGPDGQMVKPLICVYDYTSTPPEVAARMGQNFGPGTAPGSTRRGKRLTPRITVSPVCDQKLGGMDAARALASQVQGCVLYNCNRLSAFQHLAVLMARPLWQQGAQLFTFELIVTGSAVMSVDV
jgi:hypothetical protein